jgi:hypothetical protein
MTLLTWPHHRASRIAEPSRLGSHIFVRASSSPARCGCVIREQPLLALARKCGFLAGERLELGVEVRDVSGVGRLV